MGRKNKRPRKTAKKMPREKNPIEELFDKYHEPTDFIFITLGNRGVTYLGLKEK